MKCKLDFKPSFVGNSRPHNYHDLLEVQKKIKDNYSDKRASDFPEDNPTQIYRFERGKVFLHYSKSPDNWDGIPIISIRADSKKDICCLIAELLEKDIELVFNPKSVKPIE